MERVISYINKYTTISADAEAFLRENGEIVTYEKGAIFVKENEKKFYAAFLLDGLVAFSIIKNREKLVYSKLLTPFHYFVGNKHIFSQKPSNQTIQFLRKSEVYMITRRNARIAVEKFKELNFLFHLLKQKEINLSNHFINIHKLHYSERLSYFYQEFPELHGKLTLKEINLLLGFTSNKQYYSSLRAYFQAKNR